MLDIAWTEMLVLAVLIILVVGPRDLPRIMRAIGSFMRRARAMASQFQSDMDQLARETEIEELRKQAKDYKQKFRYPERELDKMIDPAAEKQQAAASGESAADPAEDTAASEETAAPDSQASERGGAETKAGQSDPEAPSDSEKPPASGGETGRG